MSDRVYNVLFLCTGNSSRSIMAEALAATLSKGRFRAFSAGSHPSGAVHPLAIELVKTTRYPVDYLRSKSWDEFSGPDAAHMDFVITVCDKAAGEVCPFWPGQPLSAHWGFEDPAALQGSDAEKRAMFSRIFREIMTRMNIFVNLPLHMLDKHAIQRELKIIGETKV